MVNVMVYRLYAVDGATESHRYEIPLNGLDRDAVYSLISETIAEFECFRDKKINVDSVSDIDDSLMNFHVNDCIGNYLVQVYY